jgi:acyl carrier protein
MAETEAQGRARQILADALFADASGVTSETAIGTDERWDSLAHARLMLAIEAKIGRLLSPEEIAAVASLGDVAALLEA